MKQRIKSKGEPQHYNSPIETRLRNSHYVANKHQWQIQLYSLNVGQPSSHDAKLHNSRCQLTDQAQEKHLVHRKNAEKEDRWLYTNQLRKKNTTNIMLKCIQIDKKIHWRILNTIKDGKINYSIEWMNYTDVQLFIYMYITASDSSKYLTAKHVEVLYSSLLINYRKIYCATQTKQGMTIMIMKTFEWEVTSLILQQHKFL